jgi:hypothetical protein
MLNVRVPPRTRGFASGRRFPHASRNYRAKSGAMRQFFALLAVDLAGAPAYEVTCEPYA